MQGLGEKREMRKCARVERNEHKCLKVVLSLCDTGNVVCTHGRERGHKLEAEEREKSSMTTTVVREDVSECNFETQANAVSASI